jgi:hypothetical protein
VWSSNFRGAARRFERLNLICDGKCVSEEHIRLTPDDLIEAVRRTFGKRLIDPVFYHVNGHSVHELTDRDLAFLTKDTIVRFVSKKMSQEDLVHLVRDSKSEEECQTLLRKAMALQFELEDVLKEKGFPPLEDTLFKTKEGVTTRKRQKQ